MTETSEKHRAITAIADLLRETTAKKMVMMDPHEKSRLASIAAGVEYTAPDGLYFMEEKTVYYNVLFNDEELASLKRKFLKLISEL